MYVAVVVIAVLLIFIFLSNGHNSISKTTINTVANSSLQQSTTVPSATIIQPVYNPTSYRGSSPVIFTQSTTLTGNIVTSSNITILLRGVIINTSSYGLISGGVFNNQGTIDAGLVGNGGSSGSAGGNVGYSYGGSGGGAWAFGCGNAAGGNSQSNGGNTQVVGGNSATGINGGGGTGTSVNQSNLTSLQIQTMYNNSIAQYLEGAGGGAATNCGTPANGGSGSYGIYIQGTKVVAGNINTVGQSGTGGSEQAGGGGGGGAILISYGNGGYQAGSYKNNGGSGGTGLYGKGGSGGSGAILTYNYSSSPPLNP